MGFHTFDPAETDKLDDPTRFRLCSREELLGALPDGGTLLDLGSGTGFYTDDVAPYASRVYAVDVQPEMHDLYREKGVPENVDLITAEAADLPFADGELDAAVSTMTYHEFASETALTELARVCAPGARVGIADWSRRGEGTAGPPTTERYALADAREAFKTTGFTIEYGSERRETFVIAVQR